MCDVSVYSSERVLLFSMPRGSSMLFVRGEVLISLESVWWLIN